MDCWLGRVGAVEGKGAYASRDESRAVSRALGDLAATAGMLGSP